MIDFINDMVYVYQVLTLHITVCLTLNLLHALSANERMKLICKLNAITYTCIA